MIKIIRIGSVLGLLLLSYALVLNGQSGPDVVIKSIDAQEEVVTLQVNTMGWMAGWVLLSLGDDGPTDIDQIYRFPALCTVKADTVIEIHSGSVANDLTNKDDICSHAPVINLYWDTFSDGKVWINDGDTACLLNRDQRLVDEEKVDDGTSDCRDDYSDVD